ncbi:inositol 2-dehydrogenase [Pararobbsia silviterrae]|uniref:Inositol 2-dehydrogenase n=1 Tax=Pararobbsia silviterrae TaxID=1792498 RepID=A0A494XDL5_9BURK|nr:inositol 2-dehydrogenase [Pararobbsia silviterrae]RKP47761.1 inositol 2-dehydrogenase [Pararobbsia silviterrae]
MSDSAVEVALFGAGRIGKIHAGNLVRQPGASLKYVVDVNPVFAEDLASKHGARVADARAVFDDPAVKAVVIGSSTDTHADLILQAAAAGKHIFCEKPVDLAIDRARACAQAVDRAGVRCLIGFQRRYDPTFAAVKARIDAGEIGTPEVLVVTSRDPGAPPVDYIRRSGGIFKDMLIHDFDIFRWILDDEAQTVYASGSCLTDPAIAEAGDIDTTAVTITTRQGRVCQINTSRRAAYGYDQRFEVMGSEGMLQAGNVRPTEVTAYGRKAVGTDLPEAFFLERYRAAYALEMAHFFEVVATGKPARTSVNDGLAALVLAEAAAKSLRERKPVHLGDAHDGKLTDVLAAVGAAAQ